MAPERQARDGSRSLCLDLVAGLSALLDLSPWVPVDVPAGRPIIQVGQTLARLPLLVGGKLHAVIHQSADDGSAVVPVTWVAGELAMLSCLFTRDPVTIDVVVVEHAQLRWLPLQDIEASLQRHNHLLVLLVRFLSQRLREVQAREKAWLARGVHERVCASLARITRGMAPAANGHVVINATHESLAARFGVSRPRLSKELKRLEAAGMVKLGRGTLEITDTGWFEAASW